MCDQIIRQLVTPLIDAEMKTNRFLGRHRD